MGCVEKVNILLVDDQPGKLLSYEVMLAELGENLIKVESAQDALHQLLTHDFAVVLLDVCMPEIDGFELAEMIRQHPRCEKTSIILVSAICVSDFDRLRGYGCGAVDYVPVPVIPEVLRAKVSVFADLYRKTEQLSLLNSDLEARVLERTAELESAAALLKASEERLNLALDSAGAAPWDWEFTEDRAVWSSRFRNLYGFTSDEPADLEMVLGRVHPGDRDRIAARIERLRSGVDEDEWNEEFRILHPVLGVRWLAGRGRTVRDVDGRPIGLTGIDLDITDRRKAEEDRAQLLKSERDARATAEEANRVKDDFLATLSHELRTPINAVLGWTQLLKGPQLEQADFDEGLRVIERGVRAQVALIDELLDLSRITSGKLRMRSETVSLAGLLSGALDTVKPIAADKSIEVEVLGDAGGIQVRGDPIRLQQVLWNLLNNACKFTPDGGRVQVAVFQDTSRVRISVTDTGLGIDPEVLPFIFDRFRQADGSITRRFGGLGLGLSIAKYIVEMHGGLILAESDGLNEGARFTVDLPVEDAATAESGPVHMMDAMASADLTGVRVLIVDDDEASRNMVARALAEFGAETSTAPDGRLALDLIVANQPDVLICDIAMPEMDGYSLIRHLRMRHDAAFLPAVALTAYTRPEDRARALAAGFNDHITKPVDPAFLVAMVTELLTHTDLQRNATG